MLESFDSFARSLQWVTGRLPCFDPLPAGVPDRRGLKAFSELAILYLYAWESSVSTSESGQRSVLRAFSDSAGEFLRTCCSRPGFTQVARREPLLGYLCILPYMALRSAGFQLASMEETIVWLAQFQLPASVETVPYRRLDRLYFLWKGGLVQRPRNWDQLLADTVLGGRRGLLHYDLAEAYSVTHTLMYVTDFGKEPATLPRTLRQRTAFLLESLIVHYWRLENWDLLGELLMSRHLLCLPESPLASAAAACFAEQVNEDGSLPASAAERRLERRRSRRLATTPQPGTMDPYTANRYHPTFVRVLYCLAKSNAAELGASA